MIEMIQQTTIGKRMNNSSSFHRLFKSNHFYKKLNGKRVPYTDEDELFYDLYSRVDEMKMIKSIDDELNDYPLLKNKNKFYTNSTYLIWESLNLSLVVRDGVIITILNLFYNLDWDCNNWGGVLR